MVKINFIIFFLSLWGSLTAQVRVVPDSLFFSGIVFNQATAAPLPDATCRYGNGKGTLSDKGGRFRIRTVRGDTVRFSYVGFRPSVVVVPDSLLESEYMLGIFLSPDTLQLSEALILQRWKPRQQQYWINARNNMSGILRQAYSPVKQMDASMNQRMMIEEYAHEVEMKGHVDVRAGVGTQSLEAYKWMKLQKKLKEERQFLNYGEIDLLKKLYYLEKKENKDN